MGVEFSAVAEPKAGSASRLVTNKPRLRLPKRRILRGKLAIAKVFQDGTFIKGRFIDLVYLCEGAHASANNEFKIAFAASRRVRTAVERNRIKRRLREAFRVERLGALASGHAILIGHMKTVRADFSAVRAELQRVFTRAGLTVASAGA